MYVKSNGVRFSYTKALTFVALAAWLATSVAIARSPENAMRGLQALGKQNADHTEVSIKRYLRSNANMILSDYTLKSEERAGFTSSLSSLAARLKMSMSTIIQKIQFWWWDLWRKSPDYVFTRLGLDREKATLFKSPAFFKWFVYLKARYQDSATEEMFKVLVDHYDQGALIKVLVAGTKFEPSKKIADNLLEIQFKEWRTDRKTSVNEVLTYLKPAVTADELFNSPVFYKWVAIVKEQYKNERINEIVFVNLLNEYGGMDALATVFAKGIADSNPLAKKLEAIRVSYQDNEDLKVTFTFLKQPPI